MLAVLGADAELFDDPARGVGVELSCRFEGGWDSAEWLPTIDVDEVPWGTDAVVVVEECTVASLM